MTPDEIERMTLDEYAAYRETLEVGNESWHREKMLRDLMSQNVISREQAMKMAAEIEGLMDESDRQVAEAARLRDEETRDENERKLLRARLMYEQEQHER